MPEETFAEGLKRFLKERNLTWGKATLRTKGKIKRPYWTPLTDGTQRATDRTLEILAESFPEDAEAVAELWLLAGRVPIREFFPQLENLTAPDIHGIRPSTARLPLGPPIPAMAGRDLSDAIVGAETTPVPPQWVEAGATVVITVDGPCLGPRLLPGDLVGLRPQDHATHGDVVLARLEGNTYTLKRYVENGGPRLTTNDPEKYPPPEGPFQIVGVMVGFIGR